MANEKEDDWLSFYTRGLNTSRQDVAANAVDNDKAQQNDLERQKLSGEIRKTNVETDVAENNRDLKIEYAKKLFSLARAAFIFAALVIVGNGFRFLNVYWQLSDPVEIAFITGVAVSAFTLAASIATLLLK